MKRALISFIASVVAIVAYGSVSEANNGEMKSFFEWDAGDVTLHRHGADSVLVDVRFDIKFDEVARNCAVVLQPYVKIAGTRTDLVPISFYNPDKNGRPQEVRRNGAPASCRPYEIVMISGGPLGNVRSTSVMGGFDFYDDIVVYVEVRECMKYEKESRIETRKIAEFKPQPCPVFRPKYFPLHVDAGRYSGSRNVREVLDLDFRSGSATLDLEYGDNKEKINGFISSIKSLVLSPATSVGTVVLDAYCSPTGSVQKNGTLLENRLHSVWKVLSDKNAFSRKKVIRNVKGEDWDSVLDWVSTSAWSRDSTVVTILCDKSLSDTEREDRLRQCYSFWDDLSRCVLSWTDRIECTIPYVVFSDAYTSDEERRKAYDTDMRLLSQRDFSLLLSSVETWSPSWYDIAFGFAEQYPDCREALLNIFAGCLRLGHLNEASKYISSLEKYSEYSDVRYYLALWHMMQDNVVSADRLAGSLDDVRIEYRQLREQVSQILDWRSSLSPWDKTVYRKY